MLVAWLRTDPIDLLLGGLADAERLDRPAQLAETWWTRAADPNCSTDANLSGAMSAPGCVRQHPQVPTQLGPDDANPVLAVAHPLGHDALDQRV